MTILSGLKFSHTTRSQEFASRHSTTFLFLWGWFVFLHEAMSHKPGEPTPVRLLALSFAAGLAGLLLVFKPYSVTRFVSLLVLTIAVGSIRMPIVPNHIFFELSVSVTSLVALCWGLCTGGRRALSAALDQALALIRIEVLIMYFFVTLHKLNYDYFNPEVSCSVALYDEIVSILRFTPTGPWVKMPMIWGVIALEGLIPIALAIPRTRVLGVGVGLFFHYMLGLSPNRFVYSYSAMMFALLSLFLPDDFLADLWNLVKRIWGWRLAGLILVALPVEFFVLKSGLVVDSDKLDDWLLIWVRLIWTTLGFTAIALYCATLYGRARAEGQRLLHGTERLEPSLFRPAVSWMLIFPVLVFFNGCCPYLGLKTQNSFAMFSNLRTEGGVTNHIFLPVRFRLADYQEDLVEVLEANDVRIKSRSDKEGRGQTFFELRRAASGIASPDFTITYIRNGQRITLNRGRDKMAEVFQPIPWLLRKLLFFRGVQLGYEPQKCCW